jgi:hypothetical protein
MHETVSDHERRGQERLPCDGDWGADAERGKGAALRLRDGIEQDLSSMAHKWATGGASAASIAYFE